VDESTSQERQDYIFEFIYKNVLESDFKLNTKDEALHFFQTLRQLFKGWNSSAWESEEFKSNEKEIVGLVKERRAEKQEQPLV